MLNAKPETKAIIGISGGKDSTIATTLCVKALGADRVVGVKTPCNGQKDIEDANAVINYLGIESYELDIGKCYNELVLMFVNNILYPNSTFATNTPARLRMTTLYAIAAMVGGRVINTSNASEIYVGYTTKWGDNVGDFAPLANLTVMQLCEIGDELSIPTDLVHKIPSDGMSGKTDEDNLGFCYDAVDEKILLGDCIAYYSSEEKIQERHKITEHKRQPIPTYVPSEEVMN